MTDLPSASSLDAVLDELGWKPEVLARRLNTFAALHGRAERMHPKTPYKWLQGSRPRSPWSALAAALITDELGRLITPADLGWGDAVEAVSAISGLVLPWTAAGSLQAVRVVTHSGSMERRIFITLLGAAASAPAHEWLLAQPETVVARSAGLSLPMAVVDHLDGVTAQLRGMDDQLGGGTLLPAVRDHLRNVLSLLDQRSYSDSVGRRLHATVGEVMRLAGWCALEGGYQPQAQRYWIAALHAAHTAGDRALGANVVRFMSEQAEDLGQIRESVTLAETARVGYPGASPRIATMLDLRAAVTHAHDRATTECRRALDAAFDRLGDSPSSSGEPDWCYWLDEAQAHGHAGACYLRLEDWSRARHHYQAALRLQDPSYVRESARRRIKLATVYLRQDRPEVDHAVALATRAVDTLISQVDSARCVDLVIQFVNQLVPYWRRPAVRQFRDHVAVLRTPA